MKRFKDPIYGYIEIEENIAENIIDTPEFQRLRNIIQTSYSPLYASAVHNRFVHSLGVYHLGRIVTSSINDVDDVTINLEKYKKIFELACLLHDIGHAPFSHTGEIFYLEKKQSRDKLHTEIIELTADDLLKDEIAKKNYSAAPHELMSVIVALKRFNFLFEDNNERSFFARCILGYNYANSLDIDKSFLNQMISMLNSSLIDVDKLDYLIRDAYITGFDTVSIDYERLLKSVKIIKKDDMCKLVYSKAAVSIIENVIFAHDSERKWIQNHPIVQYESYILKYAMEKLNNEHGIFSYEFLTSDGHKGNGVLKEFHISLLNDSDILFLMKSLKNLKDDKLINEYFARNERRHPLWKSESEYKAIFSAFSDENFEVLENEFEGLLKYLNYSNKLSANDEAIEYLNDDIKKFQLILENEKASEEPNTSQIARLKKQIEQLEKHLKWLKCLKDFANSQELDFDFIIIKADQFNSGFGKVALEDIEIEFPDLQYTPKFKKIASSLASSKSIREKFFYIFYYRNSQKRLDTRQLAVELGKICMEESA